jgi:hypothetical protein
MEEKRNVPKVRNEILSPLGTFAMPFNSEGGFGE